MDIEQLRDLARRHLRVDSSTLSAQELAEKLSKSVADSSALSEELGQSPISFKPSFYLMIANFGGTPSEVVKRARQYAAVLFDRVNATLSEDSVPALKDFHVAAVRSPSRDVLELHVTWHHILYYWSTSAVLQHLYALKLGFIFINANTNKALVCCHTIAERDRITEALEQHMEIKFTPITLTKRLLDNIGSFEKVKRAGYLVTRPGSHETEEVTYADPDLAAKPSVAASEGDPRYFRKHSFYRVDLGALTETGLGVTADTGKLWIPADTPVDTVRDFGLLLLKKFTATLDRMKRDGDIPGILKVLNVRASSALGSIPGGKLRTECAGLVQELVQMLLDGQSERPFTPPPVFLTSGVPQWFNPARLQLDDENTGVTGFWSDPDSGVQFIRFSFDGGGWRARSFLGGRGLDLDAMVHPETGNPIRVTDPSRQVELWPTRRLHDVLLGAVKQVASQVRKLDRIATLPFHIRAGRLVIDLAISRDRGAALSLSSEIDVRTVRQFQPAVQQSFSSARESRLTGQLRVLGEKCAHMTDDNCESCLTQRKFLCLRSLLARFMSRRVLLMHKGIELSDLEGTVGADGRDRRVWVFSKLARGGSGLTLRNENGAILLAQVVAQLDKGTFDTVGILSPSTINEDLRERLLFLAKLVRKNLLVVNRPILTGMLAHFEEQTKFDKRDPRKVYAASRSKAVQGRDLEAAGPFT